jgi:hypothetical protein
MTRETAIAALTGLVAALPLALLLYGFTVDDALITARVAANLAAGHGYRFNAGGPLVDAVTPLGFAPLLAAFGATDALGMLERARLLGLGAWLVAAAYLGALFGPVTRRSLAIFALLGLSAPLAAWAGAGMETGLVTGLATLALGPSRSAWLLAGICAGLRPELLPWALVLNVGRALPGRATPPSLRALALAGLAALGPAVLVALARAALFGAAAPLALQAKPSDLSHGLQYAFGCVVFGAIPLLVVAPGGLSRAGREAHVLTAALAAHLAALILAGGDWMALFRLVVPVLPTALLAGARLAPHEGRLWFWARSLVLASLSALLLVTTGWPARHVLAHRRALIERARPALSGATRVATLDAGWVGAASSGPLLDLAGVTDPVIAALPGGHTTKRIPEALLDARQADVWVLLLAPGAPLEADWRSSAFARGVEQRLAALPLAADFEARAELPLGGTSQRYLVVRRRAQR